MPSRARDGHQVVARAFRGALGEHRRLDVDEAVLVQELARFHRHAVAQASGCSACAGGAGPARGASGAWSRRGSRRPAGRAGVTDGFSTSSSWHSDFDLAAGDVGVLLPAGARAPCRRPCTQNSLRTSSATLNISGRSGSQTTCTRPSRSRRSMKMTPPWSRLRWAQPIRVTVWSSSFSLTWPAVAWYAWGFSGNSSGVRGGAGGAPSRRCRHGARRRARPAIQGRWRGPADPQD